MNVITAKDLETACFRRLKLEQELHIRPVESAKPLRIHEAFTRGLEYIEAGMAPDAAILAAVEGYTDHEYRYERELVGRMLTGYVWRWSGKAFNVEAADIRADVPIISPSTGRAMRSAKYHDRIAKIVRLDGDRRAAVIHKTTSEDIDPFSVFWRRLRMDTGAALKIISAQHLGFDVGTVIFDVTRKPSVKPRLLSQAATKRLIETGTYECEGRVQSYAAKTYEGPVVFVDGVDAEIKPGKAGYAVRETPHMYGDRLSAMMAAAPETYFVRREYAYLESDLTEARRDLHDTAKMLQDSRRLNRWPRNTNACIGFGTCPYFDLCSSGLDPTAEDLPEGYTLATEEGT